MKKKFKILIGILVLVILGFIIYKFIMLNKYKVEEVSIDNKAIFNETLDIHFNGNSNPASFEEMSYYDYFSDYVDKEDVAFKVKYDDSGKVISYYNLVKVKQYIYNLNVDSFKPASETGENKFNFATEKDMQEFLNDNNIKDDIDLLNYIKDNYYLKNSLFTSTKMMKSNYIINSFVDVAFPVFKSFTLINGDNFKGYMINANQPQNLKQIHLLHGDSQYVITLFGDEITSAEFISSLLESISF